MRRSVRSASTRLGASTGSTQPARCCSSSTSVSARQARSASASVRMPPSRSFGSSAEEDVRAGERVAERRMAVGDLDAEPGGEAVERVAGEIGLGDLGEQPGVERARPPPRQAGALAFALDHGEVEADRVADDDGVAGEGAVAPARPRRNRARRRPSRRRCRGCAVDGMRDRLAGRTSRRNEVSASRPATMRTPAISTIQARLGSRPVVSVSMTTASSAISGVALLVPTMSSPPGERFDASPWAQATGLAACASASATAATSMRLVNSSWMLQSVTVR